MPKMLLIVSAAVLGSVLAAVAASRKRQETDGQHDDTPTDATGPTTTTEGTGSISSSSAPYSS